MRQTCSVSIDTIEWAAFQTYFPPTHEAHSQLWIHLITVTAQGKDYNSVCLSQQITDSLKRSENIFVEAEEVNYSNNFLVNC